jgi:hypothetical protein
MDTLLSRYFDGELDDAEARKFLEAVESDPALERELRAYEQVLALSKKLPIPQAPAGLTQRVMAEVRSGERRRRSRWMPNVFAFRWVPAAAVAAAVALAYVGGWWTGRDSGRPTATREYAPIAATTAATEGYSGPANQASAAGNGYRYVRLVYVPRDPSIEQVHVVGSFNDWDPARTPMRREDGVFNTILLLPPGSYEYMFVVDGKEWVSDPLAVETRDDGFGGANAVLDVYL